MLKSAIARSLLDLPELAGADREVEVGLALVTAVLVDRDLVHDRGDDPLLPVRASSPDEPDPESDWSPMRLRTASPRAAESSSSLVSAAMRDCACRPRR